MGNGKRKVELQSMFFWTDGEIYSKWKQLAWIILAVAVENVLKEVKF